MPDNTARTRRCSDCDGFPTVAITTGQRTPEGSRKTTSVTCRACKGTGVLAGRRLAASLGR
ncbi:hypothetical protein [Streptomyces decoyicus]|uniref:hypothetical protein n=1 Tax=Streptomyces decoyicus TaxID=249567 RepID=UPI0006623153|nr:hypothetical protein [Streptomyces decoyicus]KOG48385.1 hypothetical protein ADK74_08585 [Streptomyces decoyicus]QZY15803.1 hypothetical protein K7C20_11455 [Streptomyces decoyicus]